eukprot:TRINITY_DN7540_c0_g1_i1.p2 TRINITY_DN7540_c0_g1~~TRINITY_DN7540_c0_g1_i1.p2  ORF type:complete len:106 (+),score=16.17 TRINITY_DN7540_c0_g1_i1:191-508(+)
MDSSGTSWGEMVQILIEPVGVGVVWGRGAVTWWTERPSRGEDPGKLASCTKSRKASSSSIAPRCSEPGKSYDIKKLTKLMTRAIPMYSALILAARLTTDQGTRGD